jgi:tRNA pseudouridine13 synthase
VTPDEESAAATGCYIAPRDLPRAHGAAPVRGRIKQRIEDFAVDEILGFEPEGDGPHVWLQIRKRDTNTQWLAGAIARLVGVPRHGVGFAGLKDRAAVTTQWFSVPVEGRAEPDWGLLASDEVELLRVTRHRKKLRRGIQKGNRFRIRVVDVHGRRDALAERARIIAACGTPNYFGEQRFGRDGGNIPAAWQMLVEGRRVRDRALRGLYLSAARSMLFNRVLARRVADGTWSRVLPGEAVMLDGTNSVFPMADPDADIEERLERLDVHPTGPMWGEGDAMAAGEASRVETEALAECGAWRDGLVAARLEAARRALRVPVAGLEVECEGADRLSLSFVLPAGAYATMAIRELVESEPE